MPVNINVMQRLRQNPYLSDHPRVSRGTLLQIEHYTMHFKPLLHYFNYSFENAHFFRLVRISSSTKNSKNLTQTLSFDEHNELTAADSMTSMHVTGYMCNSAISGQNLICRRVRTAHSEYNQKQARNHESWKTFNACLQA